jgi:ribosome-binding protein aMBF1 (putative translation factor)
MMNSYEDIMARRLAEVPPEVTARRDAIARAHEVALQVIDLREKRGLTQAQLAQRCGVDQADISRIEHGSTSPTARTLQRIADALDADVRLVSRTP